MKQVYKCEIDGKVFDRKGDCLKHEFELKGGSKRFELEVEEALKYLKEQYSLDFSVINVKAEVDWDGDPNTDEMNFVEWQTVEIDVYSNGDQRGETYSLSSEGDITKEVIIGDIVDKYVTPYSTKFEGYLSENDDYYSSGFDLNGVNLDRILRAVYGKKIRLEVIE